MSKLSVARLIAATVLIAASSAASSQRLLFPDNGLSNCADWLKHRQSGDVQRVVIMKVWAWGYLSGVVSATPRLKDLKVPDGTTVVAWLDKHCRETPLDNLALAMDELILELGRRQQPTTPWKWR